MRNSVTVAILIIVLFSIVLLNCCVFSGTKALPVLTQPSAVPSEQLPQYILDLINKDRTDNRLADLPPIVVPPLMLVP
jgi:hypothetical protein